MAMRISARRPRLGLIFAVALGLLLYGVFAASNLRLMLVMRDMPQPQAMTASQALPQSDYARFWYVGRRVLARDGLAAAPDAAVFPLDILAPGAPAFGAWLYPPPMALLAAVFAFLPLAVSFWVWRVASLLLGALLLRRAGLGWGVVAAGLASPAALHDTLGGQNGTLLGAVLVAALLLAERRPVLAGGLAGLLCVKPQLALVLPAAFLRLRFARVLAAGAVGVLVLVLASLAAGGLAPWAVFLHQAGRDSAIVVALPLHQFFPAAGITPFYLLRSLGAGLRAAQLGQGLVSVAALVLAWLAWRQEVMAAVPRMALSCCLGVLAMPYGFSYDLVGYSIAMAALFYHAGQWARLGLVMLWLMGGYTITLAGATGLLLFPLAAAAGAGMAWRLRRV